jgi:hypothetical protein
VPKATREITEARDGEIRMMGGPLGATVIVMKCAVTLLLVVLAATLPSAALAIPVSQRASLVLVGEHRSDRAGASVARAGDVNGDGHGDLIVGAPRANPLGRVDAGAAYVVLGPFPKGRLTLGQHGFRIAGAVALPNARDDNPASDGAGAVVAGAGDMNGDGLADVLVSGHDTSFTEVTFVVFGKRDSAPVDLAALGSGGSTLPAPLFGVWPVGDVNGDHRADVAIGTDIDGDEGGGALQVVYGGVGGGFLVRGIDDGMLLGSSAAAAGDVDHDGFGDMLIGAPGARPRGVVFVLRGRARGIDVFIRAGQPFRGRQVNGPAGARGFGASVARYGDGLVAGAPGTVRSTRPGSAWIVAKRTVRLAGPRTGGPAGIGVAVRGHQVLVLARGRFDGPTKALLFSANGHRLSTYTGLRNAKRTRASIATVAGSLLLGSPGASAAYLVSAAR